MKMTLKILSVFLFLICLFTIRPATSYAYWHDHGYVSVHLGVWPGYYYGYPYYGYPYYPYGDPYYYPVAAASTPTYQPVVINGATYYVNNGVYYTYGQYGYQAVATPVGAVAPAVQTATVVPESTVSDDSVTVNIPNNKGGYTAVVIKRSGNGFVGPQGEFYAEFPKVSQLRLMYGK